MFGRLTVFGRLVIAMCLVAAIAIATSAIFLYYRFEATSSRFHEETLLTFARALAKDYSANGHAISDVRTSPVTKRLSELHGEFALVDATGKVLVAFPDTSMPIASTNANSPCNSDRRFVTGLVRTSEIACPLAE